MATCGARISGGQCQTPPLANGRCRRHGGASSGPKTDAGKARLAHCRREFALRRHAALKAAGKPSRFGEITLERREAQRAGRLGKVHTTETKTAIGDGVRAARDRKRQARYDAIAGKHGIGHGAMVRAVEERKSR